MIRVEQAIKSFGSRKALNELSFTIEEGKMVGLLGANGSGKSTALKALAGLVQLDRGEIRIDGMPPNLSTRAKLSYLPDVDIWNSWMRLSDAMLYMRDVYWDWNDEKAKHLLHYFELNPDLLIRDVSKGTRAKMKLLLALSRHAKYVLLDDPFAGIDPFARRQIAQAIVEDFINDGQTIIITTHEVAEVELIIDDFLFVHDGKLLLEGHVETVKQERNQSLADVLREVYEHARL
ncbi:ATP-binding cassette domain-containing protein [Paenibacillus ginsengarvi]|uniref:ABC transporter ATP-binding protein n=1 Tax=Paenibacillus ginsengarvi TaxID=400777 RepID=A0A3B0CWL3_9BACL|nr:ABC transporter ATP-binding protein [Paenibacillus ginsengarvi]RKN86416.1 ABC transporter ATP-binding protein [Paenibacillus ginsengarvi]